MNTNKRKTNVLVINFDLDFVTILEAWKHAVHERLETTHKKRIQYLIQEDLNIIKEGK